METGETVYYKIQTEQQTIRKVVYRNCVAEYKNLFENAALQCRKIAHEPVHNKLQKPTNAAK